MCLKKTLKMCVVFAVLSGGSLAEPAAKPGSFLVKRKASSNLTSMGAIHHKAGAQSIRRFTHPKGLELVQLKPNVSEYKALEVYRNDPSVEYVEPNYIYHAYDLPNDRYFSYQWGLHNVGQTGGGRDGDINAVEAWDRLTGSENVVIGVIDSGVDYTHHDLQANMWVNELEIPGNGIDDDQNGYVDDIHGINAINGSGDPMDDNSHGTHCAGIIGAEGNNGNGVTGVMQQAKIIGCKFLTAQGSGDTASALECMDYFADLVRRSEKPVKLVATNNSWGGGYYSQAFADAVREHQRLGILFIAAAGNESNNNDLRESFPASISYSNVISVAASDHWDQIANFSNYGRRSVHVAAPGVDILSTIPGGWYNYMSGTSMAAPFVSGLAGFIKASDPEMDWVSVKNLILAGGEVTSPSYNTTISRRRIRMVDSDGEGSLSCANQLVESRLLPKSDTVRMQLGQKLKVSLLKINCAKSTQERVSSENVSLGDSMLNDRGLGGDDVAYDGVFNGYFEPKRSGTYRLRFPEGDKVTVYVSR